HVVTARGLEQRVRKPIGIGTIVGHHDLSPDIARQTAQVLGPRRGTFRGGHVDAAAAETSDGIQRGPEGGIRDEGRARMVLHARLSGPSGPDSIRARPCLNHWSCMTGITPDTPLVVFGDDWRRHVSTLQHLFVHLIESRPIVWVNSFGHRAPQLTLHDARRAVVKLRSMVAGYRVPPDGRPKPARVIEPR